MNNLPERLRNQKYNATPEEIYADSMEAADEIEKLWAVVAAAKAYEAERYHDTWRALCTTLAALEDK